MLKLGNDLKVERVEVKDVRVPEQLIQATSFLHYFFSIIDIPFGGLTNQTGYGCGGTG